MSHDFPFAMCITQRRDGQAAIVYRRRVRDDGKFRLSRVGVLHGQALIAAMPIIREALGDELPAAAIRLLDMDYGLRLACLAIVVRGLRDGERVSRATGHLQDANMDILFWWWGLLTGVDGKRALRALRILVEAVE